jgi:hypothetical protein
MAGLIPINQVVDTLDISIPKYQTDKGEVVPLSVSVVFAIFGERELAVKEIKPTPSDPIFVSKSGYKVGYIPVK